MVYGRLGFIRVAAVAFAGASCLAAAACGGTTASSLSAAPSVSSTADPLAGLTVAQLEAKVIADAKAASSVTLKGTSTQSGDTATFNIATKPGKGCTGTLDLGTKGSVKITEIGSTVYMNPDNKYWEAVSGTEAQQVIALVGGRYIKVSATDKDMASLADLCDVSQMFETNGKKDTITKGKVTTRNGTRVLALNDLTDGSTGYVTDTSDPRLIAIAAPKNSKGGAQNATVTYDAPVTLTAPPASQVIDGSKLGM
jgi:hypothetical protein